MRCRYGICNTNITGHCNLSVDCNLSFLMTRKQNETDMTERLGRFELNINQEIQKFKDDVGRNLNQKF